MKETRKIETLKNWDKNPRSIKKDAFNRLKKQIQKLGQYKPLLITPDGTVLGGNMRLRAYRELGVNDIWVSIVEPKNESEMMEYSLSDNDRAGYYDEDLLANIMPQLDLDMNDYAIDLKEPTLLSDLSSLGTEEPIEDEVPEVEKGTPESKLGEVYQLGKHRLMCGDSTDAGSVALLMNGQKADMVFTDPPYNVGYSYNSYKDNKTEKEYEVFCRKWFNNLKNHGHFIVITPGTVNLHLWSTIEKWYDIVPWIKRNAMNSGSVTYIRTWEPILFYLKPKKRRSNDDFTFNLRITKEASNTEHTCPKPLELIADLIESFTNKADSILDIFGGSGSTLIACEQTNRICYMMEIDPHYCDVIRKRYATFIGKPDDWLEITPKI